MACDHLRARGRIQQRRPFAAIHAIGETHQIDGRGDPGASPLDDFEIETAIRRRHILTDSRIDGGQDFRVVVFDLAQPPLRWQRLA